MSDARSYEFAPAFRGDRYEWFPEAIADADRLQPLLVNCLRNEIKEFRVEVRAGPTWFIRWVAMSRSQVRGGALRIDACEPDPPGDHDAPELAQLRHAVVNNLLDERPWKLSPALWAALDSPTPELAQLLEHTGQPKPRFALLADDAEILDLLADLPIGPDFTVLRDDPPPTPAHVELYLAWLDGEGWLTQRIGAPQRTGQVLVGLEPSSQQDSLEHLAELVALASGPVEGWDATERAVELIDALASSWTGRAPEWTSTLHDELDAPLLDLRKGEVRLPAHENPRRARELARSLGAEASLFGHAGSPSSSDDSESRRFGFGALGLAFGLGLGLGLGLASLLGL